MSLCWTNLHENEGMQRELGCASELERDTDDFLIFSKRISQCFPIGYSKCMGKDESLFRRMWHVVHTICKPPGERGVGSWCLWYPKGIATATGCLGSTAGPAPHVEQLCQMWERLLRSLGHLAQLSEGLSYWISWSGMGKKHFPVAGWTGSESTCSVIIWVEKNYSLGTPDNVCLIHCDSSKILTQLHIPWGVCLLPLQKGSRVNH